MRDQYCNMVTCMELSAHLGYKQCCVILYLKQLVTYTLLKRAITLFNILLNDGTAAKRNTSRKNTISRMSTHQHNYGV